MDIFNELANEKRFVCWKYYRPKADKHLSKLPINPISMKAASVIEPGSWSNLKVVKEALLKNQNLEGIGFVLGNKYVGIDFDHCFESKEVIELIDKFIAEVNSYTEYSPSKKGLHILFKVRDFERLNSFRKVVKGIHLELYTSKRYFTLTGDCYQKQRKLEQFKAEDIEKLLIKYFGCSSINKLKKDTDKPKKDINGPKKEASKTDKLLVKTIYRSLSKKHRENFKTMFYRGKPSNPDKSLSHNDYYLCNLIANFTSDPNLIFEVFKLSRSFRKKWNRFDNDYQTLGLRMIYKILTGRKLITDETKNNA